MIFLDSAAIVKMIRREVESAALEAWLAQQADKGLVASALVLTEVPRALRRSDPGRLAAVPTVLARLDRVQVDETVLATAAAYADPMLRTLDAIHLATAQSLVLEGIQLTALVTYDKRLLTAAADIGLPTAAPGAK
ncbi:type II toxin-antitoxin system VapC family toxin [Kribbella sp.]|uniref:type II toxin-antitoxin system VapC family toxin n=1 Tax=Kribbella sp. TaxID=1871183 RepID=UPI002D5116D4|nr:type II toxin-antitoxin system VapC family toxin [Kribbella sp.]HZX07228.1 type II toxin-antitoxin system VapC family toxin [Kribbella sp.]